MAGNWKKQQGANNCGQWTLLTIHVKNYQLRVFAWSCDILPGLNNLVQTVNLEVADEEMSLI